MSSCAAIPEIFKPETRVLSWSKQVPVSSRLFPPAQSQKAQTKVWAAGVQVPDLDKWLDVETDRAGRVVVNPDLTVLGHDDAFVIGDAASVPWKDGLNIPCIAPAVKQQGKYVARLRQARMASAEAPKPFFYSHAGNLATIARNSAVIDFGRIKLSGFLALGRNTNLFSDRGRADPIFRYQLVQFPSFSRQWCVFNFWADTNGTAEKH